MRHCETPGCTSPLYAKGECGACYARRRRDEARGRPPPTAFDRFWAKVRSSSPDECWEWTGGTFDGYGRFSSSGVRHPAHVYAWLLAGRSRQSEKVLDHICHNRKCVNVAHLREVTRGQNSTNRVGPSPSSRTGRRGVSATASGKYTARWTERGRDRSKTFGTAEEAEIYAIKQRLRLEAEGATLPNMADAARAAELGIKSNNQWESF